MATVTRLFADNINRLILLSLLLFIWSIDYKTPGGFSLCLIKHVTGRDCPGCGVLRGVSAVLHLDFGRAYSLNHLNMAVIPLLAYLFIRFWIDNRLG
jgi:hypothetical protein